MDNRAFAKIDEAAFEYLHDLVLQSAAFDYSALPEFGSPIERLLFTGIVALVRMNRLFGSPHGGESALSLDGKAVALPSDIDTAIDARQWLEKHKAGHVDEVFSQHNIGGYRADFLIRRTVRYYGGDHYVAEVVVECDGHDFHERTKEQATHDKRRDRAIQLEGYKVLRFTGSEIWKNAFQCAVEIDEHLDNIISAQVRESYKRDRGVGE